VGGVRTRWLVLAGLLSLVSVGTFVWLAENTSPLGIFVVPLGLAFQRALHSISLYLGTDCNPKHDPPAGRARDRLTVNPRPGTRRPRPATATCQPFRSERRSRDGP
jgi:hypothetical protein